MPKGFEVVLSRRNDNTSNPYIRVAVIRINGVVLRNNKKVVNHSPTGFEWGYGGSGPAQAAACICYELFKQAGCDENQRVILAYKIHQDFKWFFLSNLPNAGRTITLDEIRVFLSNFGYTDAFMFINKAFP